MHLLIIPYDTNGERGGIKPNSSLINTPLIRTSHEI